MNKPTKKHHGVPIECEACGGNVKVIIHDDFVSVGCTKCGKSESYPRFVGKTELYSGEQ